MGFWIFAIMKHKNTIVLAILALVVVLAGFAIKSSSPTGAAIVPGAEGAKTVTALAAVLAIVILSLLAIAGAIMVMKD